MRNCQKSRRRFFIAAACALIGTAALSSAAIPATVTATKEQLTEFLGAHGTGNMKLVFVGGRQNINRKLYILDYSTVTTGVPQIVALENTTNAILPSVSPDGQWIVYSTGPNSDGLNVPSSTYIRRYDASSAPVLVKANTAYEPRFVPNTADLTVIYATAGGSDIHDGPGQTVKMACPNGVPSGTEEVVYAGGSYIGGLNWDHTFLCTGNGTAQMVGVGTNAALPRSQLQVVTFSKPGSADSLKEIQVCNPSPSPSRVYTNTMMYLDFGYPFWELGYTAIGIDVGPTGKYDQHELFFIGQYPNSIVADYRAPDISEFVRPDGISGRAIFDDPEWSNHPYFAVSSVQINRKSRSDIGTKNRESVYLINLKDSSYLRILNEASVASDSANFQWPHAWIEFAPGFTETPDWLATGVKHKSIPIGRNGALLQLDKNVLTASVALRSVTVYNLLGSQLKSYTVERGARTLKLDALTPGTYFVQAQSVSGERATLRWTYRH